MQTIVGIFDSDTSASLAVSHLYERGFDADHVYIINPPEASEGRVGVPVAVPIQGDVSARFMPLAVPPDATPQKMSTELDRLARFGIPDDHMRLYEETLKKGGQLLVVESDDDRAEEALNIMKQSNVQQLSTDTDKST